MAPSRDVESVDVAKVQAGMQSLQSALVHYNVKCQFNVDETNLFCKLLPSCTYVTVVEGERNVRATKAMKAKNGFTAFVSTNAVGDKISMAIIRNARSPQ